MFGTVTRYFKNKGYGFIHGEDGQRYFIHGSNLNGEYIDNGYYVFFRSFHTIKGNNAEIISVIEAPEGGNNAKKKRNNR